MTAAPPPDAVQPLISASMREALIGAAIFSVLSLMFMRDQSWKMAAAAIAAGLALAYFGTAVFAQVFHVGPEYYGMIGCGCGFLGLTILGAVMKVAQMLRDDPIGTLQRVIPFLGKKEGGQ